MSSLYSVCVPQSVQFGVDISTSANICIAPPTLVSTPSLHFWRRNAPNKSVFGAKFTIFQVWRHLRKRWFRVDETQILEVGCGALCRLVAFSRALGFEEVSAMTFCKFYSIFCKVTPKVTLKVTLDSARQITFFITIVSPPISPPVSPTNFETISTPNLHFWRRNASNKPVFGAKLAILKVWCHS